jgi:hypothetical protein
VSPDSAASKLTQQQHKGLGLACIMPLSAVFNINFHALRVPLHSSGPRPYDAGRNGSTGVEREEDGRVA